MAVNPDPRTLLLPDVEAIPSFLSDKFGSIFLGSVGFLTACLGNFVTKRPLLSGIQKHIAFTIGGVVVGKVLYTRYTTYNVERDAVYRHYIDLHPDDFPSPVREKVGDIFPEWVPIR